ncbi:MAG: inhibitor of cysteine peptidase [Anaerolineaceae bacterium]|nr:MAG: inhibitor of cysteine peptidase [Anaerolineaceae bacterium]
MKPKSNSFGLAVLLAAVLFSAAGCGEAVPLSTPAESTITLTEAYNNQDIPLNVGDTLVIRLAANPSTGFTWEVQALDPQMLEQVGEPVFESPDTPPDLVGAGGTLVLTFKTLQAGTTALTLVYHRPWETDVEPLQVFSVTLTVK